MELLKLLKCSLIVLFTIPSYSQTKRAIMEGTPATNNAIFIQTATPRVGINIATPTYTLHIKGDVNVDGNYLRYGIPITTVTTLGYYTANYSLFLSSKPYNGSYFAIYQDYQLNDSEEIHYTLSQSTPISLGYWHSNLLFANNEIIHRNINLMLYAIKTGGEQDVKLFADLYLRDSGGQLTYLGQTSYSNSLTNTTNYYMVSYSTDVINAGNNYLFILLYAWRDGNGTTPSIKLLFGKNYPSNVGFNYTFQKAQGDNLGNHIATTTLNMAGQNISNANNIYAIKYYGDGANLTNIPSLNGNNYFTGLNEFTQQVTIDGDIWAKGDVFNMVASTPTIITIDDNTNARNLLLRNGLQINSDYDYAFNWIKLTTSSLSAKYYDSGIYAGSYLKFDKYGLTISSGLVAGASSIDGSGGVQIIGQDGRIPAINSTYFSNLDGSNLDNVGLLKSTQTWTGNNTFKSSTTFDNIVGINNNLILTNNNLSYGLTMIGGTKQNIRIDNQAWDAYNYGLGEIDFLQNGTGKHLIASNGDNSSYPRELIIGGATTSGGANIRLTSAYNGSFTPDLFISSVSGRVGIGTTSPAYKLDVNGIVKSTASIIGSDIVSGLAPNLGAFLSIGSPSNDSVFAIGQSTSSQFYIYWDTYSESGAKAIMATLNGANNLEIWGKNIIFSPNTNELMRLTSSGNVGIGKSNPTYPLDIVGDVNITGNYRINGNPAGLGDAVLSATQTWTGRNTYQNNSIFNSSITINANPSQQYALTIDTNNNTSDGYVVKISTSGEFDVYKMLVSTHAKTMSSPDVNAGYVKLGNICIQAGRTVQTPTRNQGTVHYFPKPFKANTIPYVIVSLDSPGFAEGYVIRTRNITNTKWEEAWDYHYNKASNFTSIFWIAFGECE